MRVLDLCSGIGGFHLGMQRAGHEVVAWCELNVQARSVYERHFPGLKNWNDITTLDVDEVPDIDIICAGIPCQAFSNAGHRRGFDDVRGTIVYDVLRIALAKKPRYVVIENVMGLLTHDNGRTLSTMRRHFERIGYSVMVRRMHSEDFVPQHRERIFIVCDREDKGLQSAWERSVADTRLLRDVLVSDDAVLESHYLNFEQVRKLFSHEERNKVMVTESITRDLHQIAGDPAHQHCRVYDTDGLATNQNALGGGGGANTGLYAVERKIKMPNGNKYDSDKTCDSAGISPALRVGGVPAKVIVPVLNPTRPDKRQAGRRYKTDGEPTFTLLAAEQYGILTSFNSAEMPKLPPTGDPNTYIAVTSEGKRGVIVGYDGHGNLTTFYVRRLTTVEGCRLQGFPDDWTAFGAGDDSISVSAQRRMIGNAVTVDVIEYIGRKLK